MPFVRISMTKGRSPDHVRAIADGVHQALTETFGVPKDDRFQLIHQHEPGEVIADPHYLGVDRSDDFLLIHVTGGKPRDRRTKRALYARLAGLLAENPGVRAEDVMVVVSTTDLDDWSFGNGEAQMVAHLGD